MDIDEGNNTHEIASRIEILPDNPDNDESIDTSYAHHGGHEKHEEVIGNTTSNGDIEAKEENMKVTQMGVTENTLSKDNLVTEDQNIGVSEISNNRGVGVTGNSDSRLTSTSNAMVVEFEVAAKEENISDPVTPDDNVEYDNVIILGSVPPPTGKKKRSIGGNELKSLGITDFKEENNVYDVYMDESERIYRKYKLRYGEKPNYRIPTTIDTTERRPKRLAEESFGCTKCNKEFFTKPELRKHQKNVHFGIYTCLLCSQTFNSNTELISHKTIHDAEKRSFLCHECKLAFSDHCDYLLHKVTHTKPHKLYKCPECGLSYNKHSYEVHIYTHFNKLATCPICAKEIRGGHNFKNHMNKHKINLKCVECGKVLNDKSGYDAHIAIHTGVRLHQCLYCGKGFRTIGQKNVHTRIHTNERPYSCNVCDRTFVQQPDLQRHEARYHSGKEKEACSVCKKRVWDMGAHMRVHRTSNFFTCPDCGKKYTASVSLKQHMLFVHSTEKPEECKVCDMRFVTRTHFNRHTKSITHKNNLYKLSLKKTE